MANFSELKPGMRIQYNDIFGDWQNATITECLTRYNDFEGKVVRYDKDKTDWQGCKKGLQFNSEGDDFPNIRIL